MLWNGDHAFEGESLSCLFKFHHLQEAFPGDSTPFPRFKELTCLPKAGHQAGPELTLGPFGSESAC